MAEGLIIYIGSILIRDYAYTFTNIFTTKGIITSTAVFFGFTAGFMPNKKDCEKSSLDIYEILNL
jgi:hypothetical protein